MQEWTAFSLAGMVGLLVGIERERSHAGKSVLGVRTFFLIGLLGALAGGQRPAWMAALLSVFALGLIWTSYDAQSRGRTGNIDRGLTTEYAAGIVFCLGYASHLSPALTATMGPLLALTLYSKAYMHRFTRWIKTSELEAALLLILGLVSVVYLAPEGALDPWGLFRPKLFGYLILTLAAIQFASYALTRLLGEKRGMIAAGFLGGWISSTAVLIDAAHHASSNKLHWRHWFCVALASKFAALLELLVIIGVVSWPLCRAVSIPIAAALLVGAVVLWLSSRKLEKNLTKLALHSPLDWKSVLRLAVTLGLMITLVSAAQLWMGDQAMLVVSLISGGFELHGVSLANASMVADSRLSLESAKFCVLAAVAGSLVAKTGMSWLIHRGPFARMASLTFGLMIAALSGVGYFL